MNAQTSPQRVINAGYKPERKPHTHARILIDLVRTGNHAHSGKGLVFQAAPASSREPALHDTEIFFWID